MLVYWDGFFWLLVLLGPLLVFQRKLHREFQAVFLLITRSQEISLLFFSLVFLPGVLLHELSHYLMARLLQVRTGKFSLLPQALEDGHLQMGYVETVRSDMIRDSLIGAAPLLTGGLFVIYAGLSRLKLNMLWETITTQSLEAFWQGLQKVPQIPDFWLWFYLLFTVSSTMLPSASDRKAWKPLAIVLVLLAGISFIAGLGSWLVNHVLPFINRGLRVLAMVMGISFLVHLFLVFPVWGLRVSLSKIMHKMVI